MLVTKTIHGLKPQYLAISCFGSRSNPQQTSPQPQESQIHNCHLTNGYKMHMSGSLLLLALVLMRIAFCQLILEKVFD